MRLARKLGTITYRSAAELRQRFGRERLEGTARNLSQFAPRFAIEGYLEAQAERFTRIFDANCYLYLSSAMDRFDLAEHGGSAAVALRSVTAESVLVIGVDSDMLFPIQEQAAIAQAFKQSGVKTRFAPMSSLEGHDAFLVDIAGFSEQIRPFLD
jgi:homoserine O-acetyltransferase